VLEDEYFEFNQIQEQKINKLRGLLEKEDNYEVIPFNLRKYIEISTIDFKIYMSLMSPNKLLSNCGVSSERLSENVTDLKYLSLVPNFLRKIFISILKSYFYLTR
jgi:hypothetical protein